MSYASTKSAAEALAYGLTDLREPTVCPDCLESFKTMVGEELKVHTSRLRVDCHALFDACIATLSFPRTPEELERLALTLAANRRRCSTHRLASRRFKAEEYLNILMASAADIFGAAVWSSEGGLAGRAEKANKGFADKHGRWPARVEQLFPAGVPATVDVLLGYAELYISKGPLCTLSFLVLVARQAIMPVLTQDAFRARLVAVVLKMLDPVASGLTRRASWLAEPNPTHAMACHMMKVLNDGPGALPHAGVQFFAGHELALLALLSRITETAADDDDMLPVLADFCIAFSERTGAPVPTHVERWFTRVGRCRCKLVTGRTVHTLICMTKSTRACAGPGCSLSIFQAAGEDGTGKPFPACARCKVPRYCSRACQLADWKGIAGAPFPHKKLCAVFCKLAASTCTKENWPEFEPVYARAEMVFSTADRQALDAFVNGVCEHSHPSASA